MITLCQARVAHERGRRAAGFRMHPLSSLALRDQGGWGDVGLMSRHFICIKMPRGDTNAKEKEHVTCNKGALNPVHAADVDQFMPAWVHRAAPSVRASLHVLRRLPWPRRFLAKAIRGPEPGAQVLEPLHLTRTLGPPPDVYLPSLLSFFVFLCLSVCEALKLRPLPFTHPVYVATRSFQ